MNLSDFCSCVAAARGTGTCTSLVSCVLYCVRYDVVMYKHRRHRCTGYCTVTFYHLVSESESFRLVEMCLSRYTICKQRTLTSNCRRVPRCGGTARDRDGRLRGGVTEKGCKYFRCSLLWEFIEHDHEHSGAWAARSSAASNGNATCSALVRYSRYITGPMTGPRWAGAGTLQYM